MPSRAAKAKLDTIDKLSNFKSGGNKLLISWFGQVVLQLLGYICSLGTSKKLITQQIGIIGHYLALVASLGYIWSLVHLLYTGPEIQPASLHSDPASVSSLVFFW